jgi:4-aminobutyrate aminotransferase-like enzyme
MRRGRMWGENRSEKEILDLEKKYTVQSYDASRSESPVIIEKAKGVFLWDKSGRRFLDFSAQYGSCNVGFQNKEMIKAIEKQLDFTSASAMFIHTPRVQLAQLLAHITPGNLGKSHFECTGSDAVEAALKFARKYTKKYKIMSLWEGYSGEGTFGALSAHGLSDSRFDFEPLLPGFVHVSPPYCYRCDFGLEYPDCGLACLEVLEKTIVREGHIAAIILEPIPAAGGVITFPDDYLPKLREICNRHNVLLILDEIVTGFGRTGKMFCCEHYNVVPDMLVIGKGFTSGYAAGAGVIVPENFKIYDPTSPEETRQVHSLSGSPLACAAAITTINIIVRDKLADNARKMGEYLLEGLKDLQEKSKIIGDVRGKGLLIGIELVKNKNSKEPDRVKERMIIEECKSRGLIVEGRCGGPQSVIVLHPPLIVDKEHIDTALNILSEVIK